MSGFAQHLPVSCGRSLLACNPPGAGDSQEAWAEVFTFTGTSIGLCFREGTLACRTATTYASIHPDICI